MDISITILVGIISSVLGAIVYKKLSERNKKNILKKIEQIDSEEQFLDKISKGNIQLLRANFRVLFLIIGLCSVSTGAILITTALELHQFIKYNALMVGSGIFIAAGIAAIMHANSLTKLNNMGKAKQDFEKKREKLRSKLE